MMVMGLRGAGLMNMDIGAFTSSTLVGLVG